MIKLDLRDRSVTGEQRVSMRLLFVFRTTEKFPRLQESSATRYLLVRVPRDAMNEGQKLGYRTAHCCMASRDLCVNRSIKAGIDNYNERLSYNVKIALRWRLLFPYDKLLFLHSELTGKPVTYVILMIILSLFTLPTIFFTILLLNTRCRLNWTLLITYIIQGGSGKTRVQNDFEIQP